MNSFNEKNDMSSKENIVQKDQKKEISVKYKGILPKDEYFIEKSVILENQRLFDEISDSEGKFETTKQILQDLAIFDLVSVQSMLGPASFLFYKKNTIEYEPLVAKARMRTFNPNENISLKIKNEINKEVLTDLRNNVGFKSVNKFNNDKDQIFNDIVKMHSKIDKATSRSNDLWIVTNKEIAENEFLKYCENPNSLKIECLSKIGLVEKENYAFNLFVDPFLTSNEILCGSRYTQNNMIDGYFYCPYILMCPLQMNDNEARIKIMSRHGKKLINKNFYGTISYV